MNVLRYLFDTFRDIGDDFNNAEIDADASWRASGNFKTRRRGSSGLWAVIWPQLIGAVLGLAVARMFQAGAFGYLIFAVLFAIIGGTYKSVNLDGIAIKHALVRNIIISVVFALFIGIAIILN